MGFEDLDVWKRAVQLSVELYRDLATLKDYGFRDQLTRSGLSIPSNIAEGEERATAKECLNFLNYAKGSCGEARTQIMIGMRVGYIDQEKGAHWIEETKAISSMLAALIKAKKSRG